MKLIKITIVTLLIFSQSSFATGSDGGNSHPGAHAPPVPPKGSHPVQLCIAHPQLDQVYCMVVGPNNN